MKVKIGSKYKNNEAKAVLAFVMNENGEVEVVESGNKKESRDENGILMRSYALCEASDFLAEKGLSTAEILLVMTGAVV